ncbi:TetR/AcrR family transcriptional regulator [Sulfitobacter sp. F26169L]|uniref:TetR/AcrR family transcriptional regulator n=1 Tax=Sulfitobacter sp. F26169L TaxID=2996015 RepID=UPI002260FB42|nr:TetR/AcrR family transcriptional regulator [Sulfitobacter sp. F26169L]MCX7567758.1 TetR/AcrR family transcriptional regulator [Sulfitobacter sp. F26169L]
MKERKSQQDRKAEILQASLDLAFEAGPDRLTTGMIADRLGLTQPAIYKHFKNKEDIWQGVANSLCDQILANIVKSGESSPTPDSRIRKLVLGHLRLVQVNPALPQIMVMRDPTEAQSASLTQIRASMSKFREELLDTIRQAQAARQLRADISASDIAALIFGIIQGLALRLLLTRDPEILLREGERLLDLQLSLLTSEGDSI